MARSSLPPGFRFHPTDVELVQYYLKRKVLGKKLHIHAIAVVDIYKFDPWDLPAQSCPRTRDLEWYFFCPRDKKHSNGARTNRATEKGYWKTTGKDRPIFYETRSVGWKKTLVFYLGRAPQGKRTDWVIHEYRLEDKRLAEAGTRQDAFVLCRLFEKSGLGPKNGEQYGAPFVEEEWEDDLAEEGQLELPILDVASSSHAEVVDPGVAAQLALVVCAPANSEAPNVHQSALVMAEDSSPFDRSCPDASIPFDEEFDIEALLAEILSDSPDVPHTATTDAGQLVIRHGGAEYDQEEIFNDLDNLNPLQVLPPNNMDVVYDTEIELLNLGGCSDTAYMGLYEPDVEVNHSGWQHTDELFYHQHQPPVPAVDPNKKQPSSSGSCYSSTTNYHCYNR